MRPPSLRRLFPSAPPHSSQLLLPRRRDLGILQQVQDETNAAPGPGGDEAREVYRLLTEVEPPRAALLSARVSRAKPALADNPGVANLLMLLEVGALYADEDFKGAAELVLQTIGACGANPELERLYSRVLAKVRCHRQYFDKVAPQLPEVDIRPPTPEPEPEPDVMLGADWEGKLRRLEDLWSVEESPQKALQGLRAELRKRIGLLAQMYLVRRQQLAWLVSSGCEQTQAQHCRCCVQAYLAVEGHGTKGLKPTADAQSAAAAESNLRPQEFEDQPDQEGGEGAEGGEGDGEDEVAEAGAEGEESRASSRQSAPGSASSEQESFDGGTKF